MAGNEQEQEEGWSDLPGDLLSAVYKRCASPFDRARLAAVCTSWRTVAAWHSRLPAMPLLLPSTGDGKRDVEARAYSPEDSRAVRVPLPWFPRGNRLVGSYQGGWIATTSGSNELLVVNLFSGARAVPLISMKQQRFVVRKIVFSADPASSRCIMVAITKQCDLALCRVVCADGGWTSITRNKFLDIAFCNDKLYGFTGTQLFKLDMDDDKWHGASVVANAIHRIDIEMRTLYVPGVGMGMDTFAGHIFELCGKLAIAKKVSPEKGQREQDFFKVFQLAEGDTMWEEVTSLGDHALFLGPASSKAVLVTAGQRGAVKGNHIYYSDHDGYYRYNDVECLDLGSCALHCCDSKGTHHLEKILSRGYYSYKDDSNNTCMWIWPPDF